MNKLLKVAGPILISFGVMGGYYWGWVFAVVLCSFGGLCIGLGTEEEL